MNSLGKVRIILQSTLSGHLPEPSLLKESSSENSVDEACPFSSFLWSFPALPSAGYFTIRPTFCFFSASVCIFNFIPSSSASFFFGFLSAYMISVMLDSHLQPPSQVHTMLPNSERSHGESSKDYPGVRPLYGTPIDGCSVLAGILPSSGQDQFRLRS
ncbi:hypothetical protein H5410_021684 [Solanum commersonii]|uniref:Uncharacterized protein n=1 Tax=Solanum commersonii TaxID=4109 RepID=A0A9J5ZBQ1_SOLCO|nr:hypothetical protein H5410_021684 [Solanum commersonii]